MQYSDLITLTCPSCGGKIQVTEKASHAVCSYCGNEHIFAHTHPQKLEINRERPIVPIPQEISMDREGRSARISRRWFSLKYVPMVFFCVAWDSFLIFWYGVAFTTDAPWIMFVFPVAHVAIGIGLTYSTLAGLLNRTTLEVTPEEISVWHDPLPWTGEMNIKTTDVKQLYARKITKNGKQGEVNTYQLMAVRRDGKAVELLSNLDSPESALFIEQRIENWLKISDTPVAGELSR